MTDPKPEHLLRLDHTNYSLHDLAFIETKQGYNIFLNNIKTQLNVVSPLIKSPFGIETFGSYLKKQVINIEASDYRKNNDNYNFYCEMKNIDNFFRYLKKNNKYIQYELPDDLLDRIEGKNYISFIKYRKGHDPLIRVFPKKNNNTMVAEFIMNDGTPFDLDSIKGVRGCFYLRLNTLWITGENYGLTWVMDKYRSDI